MPPIFVAISFGSAAAVVAAVVITATTVCSFTIYKYIHENCEYKHTFYVKIRCDTIAKKFFSPAYQSFLLNVGRFICYRAHRQMQNLLHSAFFFSHTFLHFQILCVIRIWASVFFLYENAENVSSYQKERNIERGRSKANQT